VYVSVEANTRKFTAKTKRDAATAGFFAAERFENSWTRRLNRSKAVGAWLARALPQATKWGTRTGAAWSKRFGAMADGAHIDFNRYVDDAAQAATYAGRTWRTSFQRSIGDLRILSGAAAAKIAQQFQRLGWRAAFQFRRGVDSGPVATVGIDPDVVDSFLAGVRARQAYQRGVESLKGMGVSADDLIGLSPAQAKLRGWMMGQSIGEGVEDGVAATRRGAKDGNRYARAFNIMARSKLNPTNWFSNADRTVRAVFIGLLVAGGPLVSLVSSLSAGFVALGSAVLVAASGIAVAMIPAVGALVASLGAVAIGFSALSDATGKLKQFKDAVTKEWKSLQKAVAEPLFKGLEKPVTTALKNLRPVLVGMSEVVNRVAQDFFKMFNGLDFGGIGSTLAWITDAFGAAFVNGVKAFLDVMLAAAPAAKILGDALAGVGSSISHWLNQSSNQQKFSEFLETAMGLASSLASVVKPLALALMEVIDVATQGPAQELLNLFQSLAHTFLAWTKSVEGNAALQTFFDSIALAGQALTPVIEGLAEGIKRMVTPAAAKALVGLGEAVGAILPLVGTLFNAFAESGILDAFTTAVVQLAGVFQTSGLIDAIGRLGAILGGALAAALPSIVRLLDGAIQVIIPFADAIGMLLLPIMELLAPVIDKVAEVLVKLAPKFGELMTGLVLLITPLLEPLAEIFMVIADNLDLLNPIMDLLVGILRDFAPILVPLVRLLAELLGAIAKGIGLFGALAGKVIEIASAFADWLLKSAPVKAAMDVIAGAIGVVIDVVKTAVGWISDLTSALSNIRMPDVIGNIRSTLKDIPGIGNLFAAGGMVFGPTRAIIGEAGPEAVIPLTRPLSQVDPSVRQMAAMLRGQSTTVVQQSKVPVGPSRTNIVYVTPTQSDPEAVAYSVANRLAAQAG
jgi:hypothetical protein